MSKTSMDDILASERKSDLQSSIKAENKARLDPLNGVEPEPYEDEEPSKGDAFDDEPQETGVNDETPAEPPSADAEPDKQEQGLLAAKQAEKAKRQEAEAESKKLAEELAALRKEIQQTNERQAQQSEPEQPAPSLWEDEQAWQQHFGGQVVNQATTAAAYQNKLQTSEFYARKNIDGFSDKWQDLNGWLQENPQVAQQASQDFDPWGFAWRAYSNQQTMQELGATDLNSLKEQMRNEIMAEMQAQMPAPTPNVPKSLDSKRSAGSRKGPTWSGPKSLDELLG